MHLVQILLPLYDNGGNCVPKETFGTVRDELTKTFGGVTVYSRAPAEGLWKDDGTSVQRDDVILFEVMVEKLDREWWRAYRKDLESRFRQDEIAVRAQEMELL
jgi:hypothetical protein